jgi:chemotaxis protein MotB
LLINYYSRAVVILLLIKQGVLAKVAKVVNDKPDFRCMVEGHTDSVPYVGNNILVDNWDLSVKRSTSIIRVLTNELGVNPAQLICR